MSGKTNRTSKKRSKRDAKRDAKRNIKEAHDNTSAVFRIRPSGTGMAQIKYKGFITAGEKLGDEVIEFDEVIHPESDIVGKYAIPIKRIDSYDMLGRIYRSNIVGSYIVLQSNYPLMFLTIEYSKTIVTGSLLQIYLSIEMEHEHKLEINKSKKYEQYRNLTFSGKWNLTMECDDELKELWREKLEPIVKEEALQKYHEDYEENEEKQRMSVSETLEWIVNYKEERMKWYENLIENKTDFSFRTVKRARNYFIDLAQDPRLHALLKIAMDCRILNRRKEHNIGDDTYEIPEKVTNMADIRQKMIDDDELITSYSDSVDSSSSADSAESN